MLCPMIISFNFLICVQLLKTTLILKQMEYLFTINSILYKKSYYEYLKIMLVSKTISTNIMHNQKLF